MLSLGLSVGAAGLWSVLLLVLINATIQYPWQLQAPIPVEGRVIQGDSAITCTKCLEFFTCEAVLPVRGEMREAMCLES